jgi:curli biogenesis system outer membrane secretion channel CsgG
MYKKYFLIYIILLMGACASRREVQLTDTYKERSYRPSAGPKKRIGIINFVNKAPWGEERLGKSATDILITELFKSGNFEIIEMDFLMDIDQSNNQSKTLATNIISLGKKYGVAYIITGSISQYSFKTVGGNYVFYQDKMQEAEATVDVRLFNSTSGMTIYADTGNGKFQKKIGNVLGFGPNAGYDESLGQDALRAAISQFINKLASRML